MKKKLGKCLKISGIFLDLKIYCEIYIIIKKKNDQKGENDFVV